MLEVNTALIIGKDRLRGSLPRKVQMNSIPNRSDSTPANVEEKAEKDSDKRRQTDPEIYKCKDANSPAASS